MASVNSWWNWQLTACVLIAAGGLVPNWTWTAGFWQVHYSQFGSAPPRIDAVGVGSPADAAGLQVGDVVLDPVDFGELQRVFSTLESGQQRTIRIRRGDTEQELRLVGQPQQLAAVWYPNFWHPLLGALATVLAWCVLASSAFEPPPAWRGILLGVAGLGLAAGFAWAWYVGSPFARIILWQQWSMAVEHDQHLGQSAIGFLASLGLVGLATFELRGRRSRPVRAVRSAATAPTKSVEE